MFAVSLTSGPEDAPAGHAGFLAGRYRNGALSDMWTDVSRCADGTFVGYVPACSCGWRGAVQPATAAGRFRSTRLWRDEHVARLDDPAPATVGGCRFRPAPAGPCTASSLT